MKRLKWCFAHDSAWDSEDFCEAWLLHSEYASEIEGECEFGYAEILKVK